MTRHPNKLLILCPIYEVRDYRRRLAAIDYALVVHHRVDGDFLFTLRPLLKLGARNAARFILDLARDLERGHVVIVIDRDDFLRDLEMLVQGHVTAKHRDSVERALHVIAERTAGQIRDVLDGDSLQHTLGRKFISQAPRRTKPKRLERESPDYLNGVVTPRAELLWRSLCNEWCDVRMTQHGMVAWEQWARGNRPDMPNTVLESVQLRDLEAQRRV